MNSIKVGAKVLFLAALLSGRLFAAQLVLSGNENKIELTSGVAKVVPSVPPDTLSILDFATIPPRVQHLPALPNTVIGPPSNIAITPGGRLALVANSVRIDPQDATRFIPDSVIHVIDLHSSPPRIAGEVRVGAQPSGISITKDGRRALVANRADGTVPLLTLEGPRVDILQTTTICRPEDSVSDVAIHPNGRLALASIQKAGYLAVLDLNEDGLTPTTRKISVYGQPYRCVITPDGRLGLTAGQGTGNGPDFDALSVVDLSATPIRTIDYVPLGAVPESFEVSPKGDLVAAVVMNGSNLAPNDPNHSSGGAVVLLARNGLKLTKVQELPVGRIPEGVAFTSDGRHLIVQCHPERQLWVFAVRRGRLRDTGVRVSVPGMPSSLRAAP